VDFTALKLKLISSIVAISAISLLRSFLKIGDEPLDEARPQMAGHRPSHLRHLRRSPRGDGFDVVPIPQALTRRSPELASEQHQQSQA
jgi:hypothetical protein